MQESTFFTVHVNLHGFNKAFKDLADNQLNVSQKKCNQTPPTFLVVAQEVMP
jgi:hypothetical protein